jgi:hypothetical protein
MFRLIKHSRTSGEQRFASGRREFKRHKLSQEDVIDIWADQEGKCHYTGIQLTHSPGTDWQCSLERLNPRKGYTKENAVLCALEFNCGSQWSKEKVQTVLDAQSVQHNFQKIQDLITAAEKTPPKKKGPSIKQRGKTSKREYKCNGCRRWKRIDKFYRNRPGNGCRKCQAAKAKRYRNTVRGRLQGLIGRAKSKAAYRAKKNRGEAGIFNLDFTTLLAMLREQRGLCAYSDVKLGYTTGEPWLISLERRDPFKGYTKENCCLIAGEFNSPDQKVNYKNECEGSAGWSREKVQFLRNHLRTTGWSP